VSALPLIKECHDKGINIRVDGSEIVLSAPKGILTPELVSRVKKEKPALIASLKKAALRSVQCVDMLARKLWREHYDELQQQAGDSWELISNDPDKLMDFAHHEATRRILKDGRMPDTFVAKAQCRNCGLVPIEDGSLDDVDECPWCMNGQTPPLISDSQADRNNQT